eukprot:CAMPEP_0182574016 /NCGR_PEP_ID=MMETSP1324-20130603/21567_1 /TAXON_ID=236786 /ORGANISM="Florenciella sp., Strain RCC1587" /LENGTH=712 /DNA_ID=CAMNT_0024789235 /DNA_START=96 /DNA_END=2235 /DNA_ORIENTATION=-
MSMAQQAPPPSSVGAPQPYNSASLYVGDLAPEVSEGLLFDLFNTVGPVASIRVCRDAMLKRSLGYAYVNFHNQADAERALDTMNYTMIKGRSCRIMWSQRDPSLRKSGTGNLFVKNLHPNVTHKDLYDAFSLFGNVLSCKVAVANDGKSKGYGYVHYEAEEAAKEAMSKMEDLSILDQKVDVQPFQRRDRRPDVVEWTNLYVKNVPLDWDDAKLNTLFGECGELTSATIMRVTEKDVEAKPDKGLKVGDSKGFAFVSYKEHDGAKTAVEKLHEMKLDTPEGEEGAAAEEKTLFVGRAQKKTERERELRKKFAEIQNTKIQSYMGVNLYIKNLDDQMSDKDLHGAFEKFGTITSARIMKNGDGTSKGFGFVCFSQPEEANAAVNDMNGKMLLGKPIFVALAQRGDVRRTMLAQTHSTQRQQMGGMPRGAAMPGAPQMYGTVPMMYPGAMPPNGRGAPYPMPMMMPGRGVPRGAPMQPGAYQVPAYPGMQQGMPGQQQGGRRGRRQQGPGGRGQGRQQQPNAQRNSQQFKFNEQARNQARGPVPAPMPGQSMPQPPAAPSAAPAAPANAPLTLSALAAADPSAQKNMIGERLYPLIAQSEPELAGKITGMLLEMDNSELLHLLESPDSLRMKIQEALMVLKEHQAGQDPRSDPPLRRTTQGSFAGRAVHTNASVWRRRLPVEIEPSGCASVSDPRPDRPPDIAMTATTTERERE